MRLYKIIGNTRFDHAFPIGTTVELVRTFPDGVYEVAGWIMGHWETQHVHPRDLQGEAT